MNSPTNLQLDDAFLRFANFIVLEFSIDGELLFLRPFDKEFCEWRLNNLSQFKLDEHFLRVNQLTFNHWRESALDTSGTADYYTWKSPTGALSPPYPTFWQCETSQEGEARVIAFINTSGSAISEKNSILSKKYYYQALNLPGLVHNINGPLGTILGRAELLQLKHPQMREFSEIIRVGHRLQTILNNFIFKISQEKYSKNIQINLNRFLKEEIAFLDSDLFFKHQVNKIEDYTTNIPEFRGRYDALSGVISEIYQFFRQFVYEEKEYGFMIRSLCQERKAGFEIHFSGEFSPTGKHGGRLPFQLAGDYNDITGNTHPGLDTIFLSKCMEIQKGQIEVSCQMDLCRLLYEFPLTNSTARERREREMHS